MTRKTVLCGLGLLLLAGLAACDDTAPREPTPPATEFGWAAQTIPLAAGLIDPFGLALDRDGNLYIADGDIRKRTPTGEMTIFASGFDTPSGIAIAADGTLYVADTGNNAIRKISPQGVVTTLAGDFNGPLAVALDPAGAVYVADSYNDRIRKIAPDGQVTTLAEGFDTPCALLVDAKGNVVVADTGHDAVRVIDPTGQVTTLVESLPEDKGAIFRRPVSLAMAPDGTIYVGSALRGRIFQIAPTGEVAGLTGVDIDYERGDSKNLRLIAPYGLALDAKGELFVADSAAHKLRKIVRRSDQPVPVEAVAEAAGAPLPWPFAPQNAVHEIVGTVGEVRGDDHGESREHFHAGVDVQANMGTPVLAIAAGTITDPLPNWGYGSLSEGLSVGPISYIHMRVGRGLDDKPFASSRFILDAGPRIRIKRGTKFAVGDVLGTVNRMYHTHLEYAPDGASRNLLERGFVGLQDKVVPKIEAIRLFGQDGKLLTAKRGNRILVPPGDVSIVVDAYDQTDGNQARRRLGLYRLGYQILRPDGEPVSEPVESLIFDQLPPDREMVKIAYAEGSGETVHGSAATKFLYVVTNRLRDGQASMGGWNSADLPRGDYIIRIFAADHAGNVALAGRDLPITLR